MAKQRRTFSVEQKMLILQEAEQIGVTQTLRKHNLSYTVYVRWKGQFNQGGASGKPDIKSRCSRYSQVYPMRR